jgi:COP9 signalosome complex subunit 2
MSRDPAEALRLFDRVIEDEEVQFGAEVQWRFKALRLTVLLQLSQGALDDAFARFERLLGMLGLVTSNEGNDAVSSVLEELETRRLPPAFRSRVYERTLRALSGVNERLWFTTAMRMAQQHADSGDVDRLRESVEELHRSVRLPDGRDDESKVTLLLEVYALRVRLAALTKEWSELKPLHDRIERLSTSAIADPRVMGSVHETFGRMHLERKAWEEAYQTFFDCFKAYQSAGNARAVNVLRYVLLTSMLAGMSVDPFDSQEAKAYQRNPSIDAMVQLRRAYDASDIDAFDRLLRDPNAKLQSDELLRAYTPQLLNNVRKELIVRLVRPYRHIRIQSIADRLRIPFSDAERILVSLILDERLVATIDQVGGILQLGPAAATSHKTFAALDRIATQLDALCSALDARLAPDIVD